MKDKEQNRLYFSIFCFVLLLGCEILLPCDNQLTLPPTVDEIVNPKPEQRDFYGNNMGHNLLVAVVDTGVDYNHPDLSEKIHFCIDKNQEPIRFGWDYVGQDKWPCPYIGRSTAISCTELEIINKIIEEDKSLSIYLDKNRNIVQEYLSSAWHGTTIAGVVVGNIEGIGILGYRVVPPNIRCSSSMDYTIEVVTNIINACRQAVDDHAEIIVITSFIHFEKKVNPERFKKMIALKKKFENLIHDHPDVLYIAAAGNCHGYSYDGNNFSIIDFPSDVIAENFLVVGSMNQEGNVSIFSNIPEGQINSIFLKSRIDECIYPKKMLMIPDEYYPFNGSF